MFVPHEMGAAGAPRPVRHFVLDASAISGIDASAVEAIRAVDGGLKARNTLGPSAQSRRHLPCLLASHRVLVCWLPDASGRKHWLQAQRSIHAVGLIAPPSP